MRVRFLTELRVERVPAGWRLMAPFAAAIAFEAGEVCPAALVRLLHQPWVVPEGAITDFASVPRLPLAFLLTGDTAHRSAVLHDDLYAKRADRAFADRVFLAAMETEGVPWWRRRLMYAAVRVFGGAAHD